VDTRANRHEFRCGARIRNPKRRGSSQNTRITGCALPNRQEHPSLDTDYAPQHHHPVGEQLGAPARSCVLCVIDAIGAYPMIR
jgi:hypothetical protein